MYTNSLSVFLSFLLKHYPEHPNIAFTHTMHLTVNYTGYNGEIKNDDILITLILLMTEYR